jgi:hypothetical protein
MPDAYNVFISWSGERSRLAAEALKDWLHNVLQNARPWMSTEIEKGSRSFEEIARALEGMKVGIICLTPENLTSEWLHFEAGALSKTLDAKTRVCTYLLAGLDHATVEPPLSWFQGTKANKTYTRKLVGTINNHLDAPLSESTLNAAFEKWWPDLEKILNALPAPSSAPPPPRSTEEMVAEILERTRTMDPAIAEIKEETAHTRRRRLAEVLWEQTVAKLTAGGITTVVASSPVVRGVGVSNLLVTGGSLTPAGGAGADNMSSLVPESPPETTKRPFPSGRSRTTKK